MISLADIENGYRSGIVRVVDSPIGDGAVCHIGDDWFYFGGQTAEDADSAEEYVRVIPQEDIVRMIYDVLEDFRMAGGEFEDEYAYFDSVLSENLTTRIDHVLTTHYGN